MRAESVILQWSSQVAVGFIVILFPLISPRKCVKFARRVILDAESLIGQTLTRSSMVNERRNQPFINFEKLWKKQGNRDKDHWDEKLNT